MKISNGVADKINLSHMTKILHYIKTLNGQGGCLYFTKDGLEFEISLTAYGDIAITIKHTRI